MLVKALLVAFWAGLCSLDDGGMQLQIRKPLLAGTITGLRFWGSYDKVNHRWNTGTHVAGG
mgnify:CR=1 FL=1